MRLGGIALVGAPSTEGDIFDIHHSLESLPAEAQRNERKMYITFNKMAWYEILAIGEDSGWPTGKSFVLPLPGVTPSEVRLFGTNTGRNQSSLAFKLGSNCRNACSYS